MKIEAEPEYITNWKDLGVPIISSVRDSRSFITNRPLNWISRTLSICRFSLRMHFCVSAAEYVLFPEADQKRSVPGGDVQPLKMDAGYQGCDGGELYAVLEPWFLLLASLNGIAH